LNKQFLGIRIELLAVIVLLLAVGVGILFKDHFYIVSSNPRSVEAIKQSGKLRVLTQNMPVTYFIDRDGNEAGPEYEVVKAFSDHLGVEPQFILKNGVEELLQAVANGEAEFASGGLSVTEARKKLFLFGPRYQQVFQQVVCRRGGPRPRNIKDLYDVDLIISSGTSYAERLTELKVKHPELNWTELSGIDSEQILETIWNDGGNQCTVMDSTIVAVNQRFMPELKVMFNLGSRDELAWVFPEGAQELQQYAIKWFKSFKKTGHFASIQERYYGHVGHFDYVDTQAFIKRIDSRYSKYQQVFKAAAKEHDLPELLLASQAYQESHWNPKARSPTGVRGMMMLTLPTAKSMGVTNRLSHEQSIHGGAKYLALLKQQLSEDIEEPDLTWIALAAYNVGLGHVKDAQKLAVQENKNPAKWHDLKHVLPLLSKKKYYKDLYYGYARGSEPVRYVQQIREYRQILYQQILPVD